MREVLLGRLVKPEEDHKPPVPLQRSTPTGLIDDSVPVSTTSRDILYPCALTGETITPSASLHVIWLRPGVIVP